MQRSAVVEYFLLRQEEKLINPFLIDTKETDITMKEAFIAFGEIDDNTSIPEFFVMKKLFDHYFFVSDRFKTLLDVYADNMDAIPVFLTDIKRQKQLCYWKIIIEEKDCININNAMRYDNLTLIKEKIESSFIFRIVFDKQEYMIVSLVLAEHMLRKNLYGIKFIPVHLIQGEEEDGEG